MTRSGHSGVGGLFSAGRGARALSLSILTGLALVVGCAGDVAYRNEVAEVPSPAPPGSGEPGLAVGADGRVYLSWIEERDNLGVLRFSVWEEAAWSVPRTAASGTNWFINWADVPAMSALADGTLLASWLEKTGDDTYAYGIRLTLSTDAGRTWSEPIVPHRDGTPTEHGFVSFVPEPEGSFGIAWLDGRETGGGHDHGDGHGGGGAMTLRFASVDREGALSRERLLDPRVCDCCPTDVVLTPSGSVLVAYRDRSEEEIRDISVVRLQGEGASAPATAHADGWKIEGCPVNGPALATSEEHVALTWYTVDANDRATVRLAFSEDEGESFGQPVQVDDGNPIGRVDITTLPDGSALVVWLETVSAEEAEVRLRRVTRSGVRGPHATVARTDAGRVSGYPRVARAGETVLVAWTEAGETTRVRTAVYR